MKAALNFLVCIMLIISTQADDLVYTEGHNGRPHCDTAEEMKQIYWRNNNDPTTYWMCEEQHVPATALYCEPELAFLQASSLCVPWRYWNWEEPRDPPSKAD